LTDLTALDGPAFEFAALERARHYGRAIAREFATELCGRVLEVGAGIGQMSRVFTDMPGVRELVALEPEEAFAPVFRARVPNVRLIQGTTATLDAGEHFDAAVMINVLEHIPDHVGTLRELRPHLHPRAPLCLLVPACPELYAAIDARFGHVRRYTKPVLRQVLEEAGYTAARLHYFNAIGYALWYLNFTLRGATTFNPTLVGAFDSTVFRAVNWVETHIARPPIGQSLIAVAYPAS